MNRKILRSITIKVTPPLVLVKQVQIVPSFKKFT